MTSRSRARQLAVQVIYQYEYSGYSQNKSLDLFWKNVKVDAGTKRYTEELMEGVLDCLDELNLEIGAYLKNWSIDRIVSLDKIVLQIAFYELLYNQDVPWRVVVDEAVDLAKMFSGEKNATFINGVLHAWATKNRLPSGPGVASSATAPAPAVQTEAHIDDVIAESTAAEASSELPEPDKELPAMPLAESADSPEADDALALEVDDAPALEADETSPKVSEES